MREIKALGSTMKEKRPALLPKGKHLYSTNDTIAITANECQNLKNFIFYHSSPEDLDVLSRKNIGISWNNFYHLSASRLTAGNQLVRIN